MSQRTIYTRQSAAKRELESAGKKAADALAELCELHALEKNFDELSKEEKEERYDKEVMLVDDLLKSTFDARDAVGPDNFKAVIPILASEIQQNLRRRRASRMQPH